MTSVDGSTYRLRFGDLDLSPSMQTGEPIRYRVSGLLRGRPVPTVVVLESMIRDGALEQVDRYGNRDQELIIGIEADDADLLAKGEAALFVECQKALNELAWTPPGGVGATTVYDIVTADLGGVDELDANDWDLDEVLRGLRTYRVALRAAPFGRSAVEEVDEALVSSGSTTVVISDGTSATGWSSPAGAVTVVSGQLQVPKVAGAKTTRTDSYGNVNREYDWEADLTLAATDFTATPYVTLEVDVSSKTTQPQVTAPKLYVDGLERPLVAAVLLTPVVAGWNAAPIRCTYLVQDSSATTVRIVGETKTVNSTSGALLLDNVSRSSVSPSLSTTGRQSLRTINVGGSARTQGRVIVSHETGGLGDLIVYSRRELGDSNAPDLRRRKSVASGVTTTDASTISGFREPFNGGVPVKFTTPAVMLDEGGYLIYARVRATSGTPTTTFTTTAATVVGSTTLATATDTSEAVSLTTSTWKIVPVGSVVLPPSRVSESSGASVTLTVASSASTVEWDEMWAFYMGDNSALTIVALGDGTPAAGSVSNRFRLDTPTLADPRESIWAGTLADWSDSFHAGTLTQTWQVPDLPPGVATFFIANSGAANPSLQVARYRRFHTHATRSEPS